MTDWTKLRRQKELIRLREGALENWRQALQEEGDHPFVDVMPSEGGEGTKTTKKKEKKQEEESEEKEEGRKPLDLKKERKL